VPNRSHNANDDLMIALRAWLNDVYPGCQAEKVRIVFRYPLTLRNRTLVLPVMPALREVESK
jgi:hypothetical protein